jgi:hypothetical protein
MKDCPTQGHQATGTPGRRRGSLTGRLTGPYLASTGTERAAPTCSQAYFIAKEEKEFISSDFTTTAAKHTLQGTANKKSKFA